MTQDKKHDSHERAVVYIKDWDFYQAIVAANGRTPFKPTMKNERESCRP